MGRAVLLVPGDIETRTGGYIYDKRMVAALRAHGWRVDVRTSDLAAIPDDTIAIVDGLALVTLGDEIVRHAARLRLAVLVHLPLGLEPGLDVAEAERRDALEREALRLARLAIATGRRTVDALASRGVRRVVLVEPGTDSAPRARGSHADRVALVAVAALTSGKGHEPLLRALAAVPATNWSLTCAGSLDRDPATTARVRSLVGELGLADRVTLAGELDDRQLADLYDRSDVVVSASVRETYGMATAEAIARALPVVATDVGEARAIAGDGGLLVPPGEHGALADALTRVITDADVRACLRERAAVSRTRLRTWDEASRTLADALAGLDADD